MRKNVLVKAFANNFLSNTDTITLNYLHNNMECVEKFLNDLELNDNERTLLTDMGKKLFKASLLLTNIQNWDMLAPLMSGDYKGDKENFELEFNAVMEHIYQIATILNS